MTEHCPYLSTPLRSVFRGRSFAPPSAVLRRLHVQRLSLTPKDSIRFQITQSLTDNDGALSLPFDPSPFCFPREVVCSAKRRSAPLARATSVAHPKDFHSFPDNSKPNGQ